MTDKTWKRAERTVADILGGVRVPITGRIRGSAPDIEHDWLSIEVKHRKRLPEWIHDAMRQAEASVRGSQLPIAVLHEQGQRFDQSFVVIRLGEFTEWFGD